MTDTKQSETPETDAFLAKLYATKIGPNSFFQGDWRNLDMHHQSAYEDLASFARTLERRLRAAEGIIGAARKLLDENWIAGSMEYDAQAVNQAHRILSGGDAPRSTCFDRAEQERKAAEGCVEALRSLTEAFDDDFVKEELAALAAYDAVKGEK